MTTLRFFLATLIAICGSSALTLATAAPVQLSSYSEDFEGLNQGDPSALGNAGWLVFANVFDAGGGYLYGYGPFPAPNGGPGFSAITTGQGGPDQGAQQLVTYSDYNNGDHANGFIIETNVFQEQIVGAGDVGKTFEFRFDAKLGDLQPNSTASAFIKIIDHTTFALDGYVFVDTTSLPTTWGTYSLSITIDPAHVGDFFQIGFQTNATLYTPSGVIYDNIVFGEQTLGTRYCTSTPNSTGFAATIAASGSTSILANDLVLTARQVPDNQSGIFYYGPNQTQVAFGDGFRCIAGPGLARFPVVVSSGGAMTFAVDYLSPPYPAATILPGSTWNFQAWYRDPAAGGATFNFSDAVELTFVP